MTRLGGSPLVVAGLLLVGGSFAVAPTAARGSTDQVWSAFVLVAGLILVGLVADEDGLFAWVGHRLAALAPGAVPLFIGSSALVAVVTAVLNLDTSVLFVTPVLVYAARSRAMAPGPLLTTSILVANAGSLLLPGSNLTNLIVLGHLHRSGGAFAARMALPWVGSLVVTTVVIAVVERASLRAAGPRGPEPGRPTIGLGVVAVGVAAVCVLVLRNAALPVAAVGLVAVAVRLAQHREQADRVRGVLGLPVLVALFGLAVALGTLGRSWAGPATLLGHLGAPGTTAFAALASVVVNNLPAASLLAARTPPHPYALLIGLDIGPNLFVTGSLAWVLWWRTARSTGERPPRWRAVVIGAVSAPVAMAVAVSLLGVTART